MGRDDDGATAVEYAIIAALIAGVIIAIVAVLGSRTTEALCAPLESWDEAVPSGIDTGDC